MTVLHRADIPDHGKVENHVYVTDLVCKVCGKQLDADDAFTTGDDGHKQRNEFVPCTKG